MFYLSLLLLWLPQVAEVQPPTTAPATTAPTYDQGPLRAEIVAMREMRFSAADPELAARMESDLRMQIRLRGEKITKVARNGELILTELVDDTGQSLLEPDAYTEADKTRTRPIMFPPERLRDNGLLLVSRSRPAARGAHKLSRLRGTVRLILADELEKYTIENPLQYYGQTIQDPRLQELGIKIDILPVDQLENGPPANRCIIFAYRNKGEHVQKASFCDGRMQPLMARDTWVTTTSGEPCQLYYFDAGALTDEMQLVLEVHPQIEDLSVPVELDDIDLP
jgi:hypothetical protein